MSKEKSQILEIVCKDGWELQNLEDQWKSDKEVVLAAVQSEWPSGHALEFASDELKKDKQFILAAIQKVGWALQYADTELRKDKEVVLVAVKQDGWALKYADEKFKKDKEIVFEAANHRRHRAHGRTDHIWRRSRVGGYVRAGARFQPSQRRPDRPYGVLYLRSDRDLGKAGGCDLLCGDWPYRHGAGLLSGASGRRARRGYRPDTGTPAGIDSDPGTGSGGAPLCQVGERVRKIKPGTRQRPRSWLVSCGGAGRQPHSTGNDGPGPRL